MEEKNIMLVEEKDVRLDFFQELRKKVRRMAMTKEGKENKYIEYLLIAPDLFHLMVKLVLDTEVDAKYKVYLGMAIAYFISPLDLVPDVAPVVGLLDDVVLAAIVMNGLMNKGCSENVVKKHWAGDEEVIVLIKNILKAADDMVGTVVLDSLKKVFKNMHA